MTGIHPQTEPVGGRLLQVGSFSNEFQEGRLAVALFRCKHLNIIHQNEHWSISKTTVSSLPKSKAKNSSPKQMSNALACRLIQQRCKFLLRSCDMCRCGFIAQRGNGQLLHSQSAKLDAWEPWNLPKWTLFPTYVSGFYRNKGGCIKKWQMTLFFQPIA